MVKQCFRGKIAVRIAVDQQYRPVWTAPSSNASDRNTEKCLELRGLLPIFKGFQRAPVERPQGGCQPDLGTSFHLPTGLRLRTAKSLEGAVLDISA